MSNAGDFPEVEFLIIQVQKEEGKFVVAYPRPPQNDKLGVFTS